MRRCPFCEAELSETALKCQHCGEWVKPKASAAPSESPPVVLPVKSIPPPPIKPPTPKVSRRNLRMIFCGALLVVIAIIWPYKITRYRVLLAQADLATVQARADSETFDKIVIKDGKLREDLPLRSAALSLRAAMRSLNGYDDAIESLRYAEDSLIIFRIGKPRDNVSDLQREQSQLREKKRTVSRGVAARLLRETIDEAKAAKTDSNLKQLVMVARLLGPAVELTRKGLSPLNAAIQELKEFSVAGVSAWDALEKIFPSAAEVGEWVEKLYRTTADTSESARKIRDGVESVERSRAALLQKRDWPSLVAYNAAWKKAAKDFAFVEENLQTFIEPQEKLRKQLDEFRAATERIEEESWVRKAAEKAFVAALKLASNAISESVAKLRSYQDSLAATRKEKSYRLRDELIGLIGEDGKDVSLAVK